jgi:hypothetical protein
MMCQQLFVWLIALVKLTVFSLADVTVSTSTLAADMLQVIFWNMLPGDCSHLVFPCQVLNDPDYDDLDVVCEGGVLRAHKALVDVRSKRLRTSMLFETEKPVQARCVLPFA